MSSTFSSQTSFLGNSRKDFIPNSADIILLRKVVKLTEKIEIIHAQVRLLVIDKVQHDFKLFLLGIFNFYFTLVFLHRSKELLLKHITNQSKNYFMSADLFK